MYLHREVIFVNFLARKESKRSWQWQSGNRDLTAKAPRSPRRETKQKHWDLGSGRGEWGQSGPELTNHEIYEIHELHELHEKNCDRNGAKRKPGFNRQGAKVAKEGNKAEALGSGVWAGEMGAKRTGTHQPRITRITRKKLRPEWSKAETGI